MVIHDKRWAIQQMLDGKKVLQGESTILKYSYGQFYQVAGDCMGAVEINSLPRDGYTLYEEPEKVELPEESLTISSQCAELFLDYLDKDELLEEFMRRQVMLLASELDKVNRELKLIQYASWKDQIIEDREGIRRKK